MATFPIILDSCLVCDGRRVEPTDLIDIFLDEVKFPEAENPVRAVVLDVRLPEPPESILGKVALDVEVADNDMPAGVSELNPDDIAFVKCVDCCVRNTERIEELEEKIVGTQETIRSIFPPFLPHRINLNTPTSTWAFLYKGQMDGFPFWETEDSPSTRRIRRDGDRWILTTPGDTYVQQSESPVAVPWILPASTLWTHNGPDVAFSYTGFAFNTFSVVHETPPIPPSAYDPNALDSDTVLLVDDKANLWYWTGTTWRIPADMIPWDAVNPLPDNRIGVFYRITGSAFVDGRQVWPGDVFWRNYNGAASSVVQVGAAGSFYSVGVTTNTIQTITAAKTWTALQTFSSVDINSGNIDSTTIGSATAADGSFEQLNGYQGLTLGCPLSGRPNSPNGPADGAVLWYHANNNLFVAERVDAVTQNRTQYKPNGDGYYALTQTPTGVPNINEISGIAFGRASLVGGYALITNANLTHSSIIVVSAASYSGTPEEVTAYCSDGEAYIQSTSNTDTRWVNYILKY